METVTWHIGCAGYSYPEWKGVWYPNDLPRSQWFSYYARYFQTLELNATFYRFPTLEQIQRWKAQAPSGFLYILKAPRMFTHHHQLDDSQRLKEFFAIAHHLEPHLGGFLFQFPRSQKRSTAFFQRLAQLRSLSSHLIACEFRHPQWWQPQTFTWFEEHNLLFCSVLAPQLPQQLIVLNQQLYLRIHGDPWYAQNFTLDLLRTIAHQLQQLPIQTGWIIFNNTVNGYAPQNASSLQQLLSSKNSATASG